MINIPIPRQHTRTPPPIINITLRIIRPRRQKHQNHRRHRRRHLHRMNIHLRRQNRRDIPRLQPTPGSPFNHRPIIRPVRVGSIRHLPRRPLVHPRQPPPSPVVVYGRLMPGRNDGHQQAQRAVRRPKNDPPADLCGRRLPVLIRQKILHQQVTERVDCSADERHRVSHAHRHASQLTEERPKRGMIDAQIRSHNTHRS